MEQVKREINFEFPFEPYDIQKSFMNTLYETLMNEKIGIFESPTGTVNIYVVLYIFINTYIVLLTQVCQFVAVFL